MGTVQTTAVDPNALATEESIRFDVDDEIVWPREEMRLPGYWELLASNSGQWARDVDGGPFWTSVKERIDQWRSEYRQQNGADLLTPSGLPAFVGKPSDSTKAKVTRYWRQKKEFRESAIPKEGAPIPAIGDLVRTRVVCKYMDGVEFLASRFERLARDLGVAIEKERAGRLQGYFAQHLQVEQDVIYRFGGASELAKIKYEIQVASELSTRMWETSHALYEFSREETEFAEDWQWNPNDPRFLANQLGHMIHLADGLLVQLRQATGKGRANMDLENELQKLTRFGTIDGLVAATSAPVKYCPEPFTHLLPSLVLGQDGPTLVRLLLISENYLCDIDLKEGESDFIAKRTVVNYRFRSATQVIKRENEPGLSYKVASVVLLHDIGTGAKPFATQIDYVGEDPDSFFRAVLAAIPIEAIL